MLGYDYEIIYKKVKDNVVANALSRKYQDKGFLFPLSSPVLEWLEEACQEWLTYDSMTQLIKRLQEPQPYPRLHLVARHLTI